MERKSSIEREPRTLNIEQIQYARAAALYVMNNSKSIEEALRIFTKGLEPVVSAARAKEYNMMDSGEDEDQRDFFPIHVKLPTVVELRDIVTAPF